MGVLFVMELSKKRDHIFLAVWVGYEMMQVSQTFWFHDLFHEKCKKLLRLAIKHDLSTSKKKCVGNGSSQSAGTFWTGFRSPKLDYL